MAELQALLNFATADGDGTVKFILDNGWTGTNQRTELVHLHDTREHVRSLSLEREGFVLRTIESDVTDYADAEQVDERWKPAVKRTILQATGGSQAFLFAGPLLRFSEAHEGSRSSSVSAPARAVHSDMASTFRYDLFDQQPVSEEAARELRTLLGDREPSRWRVFNIWQMISEPPQDCTLAICDRSSTDCADILNGKGFYDNPAQSRDAILAGSVAEADFDLSFFRYNPQQKWCFFSHMLPGEAMIFSAFDPQDKDGNGRVAHAAVTLPGNGAERNPRQSIEVRALVIYDD